MVANSGSRRGSVLLLGDIYGKGGGKLLPVGGKRARVLFVDLRRSCRAGGPKIQILEGI